MFLNQKRKYNNEEYALDIEFMENGQIIDDEKEFQDFCSILAADRSFDFNLDGKSVNTEDLTEEQKESRHARKKSTKKVKPNFMQSSRTGSSSVSESDVRLRYAQLFINAFNGFDREDLMRKLEQYCMPDCCLSVKWMGEIGNPCGPNERKLAGLTAVSSFVEAVMVLAVPDAVMQVLDSKLRIRPDGESSYLICKYSFNGTQVFKITPENSTDGNENEPIVGKFIGKETLPKITKMMLIGTLILHINSDNKIMKFEFIQEVVQMRVLEDIMN